MRNFHALSEEEIRRIAPSVFAEEAHESRSDRFRFFSTAIVVNALRDNGFLPVRAQQTRCRDIDKRPYTKHMLRFRRENNDAIIVGDSYPEVVLVNAHDGTSAYKLYLGIFRYICSNGAVVMSQRFGDFKVRHMGPENIANDVIDVSFQVIGEAPKVTDQIEEWRATPVPLPAAEAFAESAALLRWEADATPIDPRELLTARRYEDQQERNTWGLFNRVQENLLKGGIRGRARTGRRTTTRAVNSVTEDVKLNRALWHLTEEFQKLVKAA